MLSYQIHITEFWPKFLIVYSMILLSSVDSIDLKLHRTILFWSLSLCLFHLQKILAEINKKHMYIKPASYFRNYALRNMHACIVITQLLYYVTSLWVKLTIWPCFLFWNIQESFAWGLSIHSSISLLYYNSCMPFWRFFWSQNSLLIWST